MADDRQIELNAGGRMLHLTEEAARAIGARLCYGDPVEHGELTVIPVASLSTLGGFGFGGTAVEESPNEGGGGGGMLNARPVGFIEISDSGARFQRVITTADVLQALSWIAATVALGRVRRLRRRR